MYCLHVVRGRFRRQIQLGREWKRTDRVRRRIRRERLHRRYRKSIPVAAGIFFTAAILWALTGALLPFLQEPALGSGGGSFTDLVGCVDGRIITA